MANSSSNTAQKAIAPGIIILCGALISMMTFGPRSAMGSFQLPIITEYGWGRDIFGFALAIQNLMWGIGQPFAGAMADRYGSVRVLMSGLACYALSLVLMTVSSIPGSFTLTAGALFGLALAGCSFNLVLAAFGKLLPPERRPMAFGIGTAAGSFGQFLFSPLAVGLITEVGWRGALLIFAGLLMISLPLALALRSEGNAEVQASASEPRPPLWTVLAEAFSHNSYILLLLGFFTCGFHLAFITVHLPAFLKDSNISAEVGGWVVALIGLCNIVGSLSSGWLTSRYPRRYLLAAIYALRAVAFAIFVFMPVTTGSALFFGAFLGLLWLSTVPPTSALVAVMFGTRNMAMLYGFVFFSHQVGGFLGVWLGGLLYEKTGNYDLIWYASIALGIASAVVNLPIIEKSAADVRGKALPA